MSNKKVEVRFYDIEWEGDKDYPNEVNVEFTFSDKLSQNEIENIIDNEGTEWLRDVYDAEIVYETNFEIINN